MSPTSILLVMLTHFTGARFNEDLYFIYLAIIKKYVNVFDLVVGMILLLDITLGHKLLLFVLVLLPILKNLQNLVAEPNLLPE